MLLNRLGKPVAAPSFPIDWTTDGGFDTPGLWGLARCAIASSQLQYSGQASPIANVGMSATPLDGQFTFTVTVSGWVSGATILVQLGGGTTLTIAGITGNGVYTNSGPITGIASTILGLRGASASTYNVDSYTLVQTA